MDNSETLLRAILAAVARTTFPPEVLHEIITSGRSGAEKQVEAYNLCDGRKSQAKIADAAGIDRSNFNKSLSRWIEAGIILRLGEGRDAHPVHVYPLPESFKPKAK
jgi:hypothetical protein